MLENTFVRFLAVGLLNTAAGLGVIYTCKWFLGFGDVLANVLGYAVGLTISFVLNSRWTFRYRGPVVPAIARFLGVFLLAYCTNLSVVLLLIDGVELNSYLAQAMGMPPYMVVFYIGSRWLAFRESRARRDSSQRYAGNSLEAD